MCRGREAMKKKNVLVIALILCLIASLFGCGANDPGHNQGHIKIVTTVFPQYDWAKNILGDNPAGAELVLLADNGADMHSFQPGAQEIVDISTADVLIYVGGESDTYIDDVLKTNSYEKMHVINLLESAGEFIKEEELVEGMEGEEEEESEEEEEPEYDEHVWLSLKAASGLCDKICDAICQIDPSNEEYYRKNLKEYKEKLTALDDKYAKVVSQASTDTILFGDRFPFRYMVDDYGIKYFAAFVGCSSETDASFETVTFLAKKVDELGLDSVMIIENSDGAIAQAIISNTETKDQKVLTMDSMQSVTADDIEAGETYLGIMEENLRVLQEALN